MEKQGQNNKNENISSDANGEKLKNNSLFLPIENKERNNSQLGKNMMNLQNRDIKSNKQETQNVFK